MQRIRLATVLGAVAAVALMGVLVTLGLQVADAADWTPPDRVTAAPPAEDLRACTNTDLLLSVDDLADDPASDRRRLALVWDNESATPCRLDGFPIVDLVGPATPRFGRSAYGSIVNVPRDDVDARPLTLGPGESARSVLRWTPPGSRAAASDAQVWTPDRLVVATPGERRNQSVAWPAGPIAVAGGGTDRPGLSFGPLTGD